MLVVGTRTETFAPPTQTAATSGAATSMKIGDMIMSGLGGMGGGTVSTSSETGVAASSSSSLVSSGSETSAAPFTGAGRRQREVGDSWLGGGGLGIVIGVVASL